MLACLFVCSFVFPEMTVATSNDARYYKLADSDIRVIKLTLNNGHEIILMLAENKKDSVNTMH